MATYTTELRSVIRAAETQAHGSYTDFRYTSATWDAIGLADYPIHDESHRSALNQKICDHFYMREIGAETVSLFRLFMRRTMSEIMPYYNQLYESVEMLTEPMSDYDVTRSEGWGEDTTGTDTGNERFSGNRTSSSTNDSTTDTTSDSRSVFSDTPMSMVQDDGGTLLEDGSYATTATFDHSSTNVGSNSSTSQTDETANTTDTTRSTTGNRTGTRTTDESGRRTSQADLIRQYRDAIINVDRMILDDPELNACFMQVY